MGRVGSGYIENKIEREIKKGGSDREDRKETGGGREARDTIEGEKKGSGGGRIEQWKKGKLRKGEWRKLWDRRMKNRRKKGKGKRGKKGEGEGKKEIESSTTRRKAGKERVSLLHSGNNLRGLSHKFS
jgi:hypothetical protein